MKVLVVDDDGRLRQLLGNALRDRGVEVRTAATHQAAVDMQQAFGPTHAVVDLKLGADDGLQTVQALCTADPAIQVVLLTGYGSIPATVAAVRAGAVNVLQKPAGVEEVLAAFGGPSSGDGPETPSLAQTEWEHIQRVLADCDGNISEAARRLGLHRRTLQRKLQKRP